MANISYDQAYPHIQFLPRSRNWWSWLKGTPAECIRFLELYEALGIEEVFMLCAVGPARHEEVMNTIRLFGEQVIPHFQ